MLSTERANSPIRYISLTYASRGIVEAYADRSTMPRPVSRMRVLSTICQPMFWLSRSGHSLLSGNGST